jgi:DNA processing protein
LLIRDGAVLVQSAADVIELVSDFDGSPRSSFRDAAANDYDTTRGAEDPADIAALLTIAPVPVDELIRQSGAGASAVQLALLELELAGRLQRHAGGKVSVTTGN